MDKRQMSLKTVIGELWLVGTATGLQEVRWDRHPSAEAVRLCDNDPVVKILRQACEELQEYLAGKRTRFDVPLIPEGTSFQQRVWAELRRIPYGKTVSYREIAARIGKPNAARAVGTANGRNPLTVVVPCHRVIAADGALGGYSGGLDRKARLLALEARQS